MAFQKDTIRLGAAQRIFPHFNIKELTTAGGNSTGLYSATLKKADGQEHQIVEKGLTTLCELVAAELRLAYRFHNIKKLPNNQEVGS